MTGATADSPAGDARWSTRSSPNATNAPAANFLTDVDCPEASRCLAVGHNLVGTSFETLIQHWDGSRWETIASPNTGDGETNALRAIECVSADDCWAVGNAWDGSNYQTLVLHWDGSAWTIVPSPNGSTTHTNSLNDVTCISATDCWAVGSHYVSLNETRPMLMRWDGLAWTIVAVAEAADVWWSLSTVACPSPSRCWAAGTASEAGASRPLLLGWDGTSWVVEPSPEAADSTGGNVGQIACAGELDCWAVGARTTDGTQQPLAYRWQGATWTSVEFPTSGEGSDERFAGVACSSASDCWAVGTRTVGGLQQPLTAHWDGAAWQSVDSPAPGPHAASLSRVACADPTTCFSVGFHRPNVHQTLLQRWDGASWNLVASHNRPATQDNRLGPVTCVSEDECWAVGYYAPRSTQQTLILRWDGASWSVADSPNASTTAHNILTSVSCAASDDCWAVGAHLGDGVAKTLILHWDGSSWTIVDSPNAATAQHSILNAVTCVSPEDCWSVGYGLAGGVMQPIVLRWDGATWQVEPPLLPTSDQALLYSIACTSTSDCWAVGHELSLEGRSSTMILHWDGTLWLPVVAPDPAAGNSALYGVSCASAASCFAVGTTDAGGGDEELILRWADDEWVLEPSTGAGVLVGVDCLVTDDCRAAGGRLDGQFSRPLIRRWDGSAWNLEEVSGIPANRHAIAGGVDCWSATGCIASGFSQSAGFLRTLALHYGVVERAPTPTSLELTVEGRGSSRVLRARLTLRDDPSAGVGDKTLSFFVDGTSIGTAVTDPSGYATLEPPPRYRGGRFSFSAHFAGDESYGGAEASTQT